MVTALPTLENAVAEIAARRPAARPSSVRSLS